MKQQATAVLCFQCDKTGAISAGGRTNLLVFTTLYDVNSFVRILASILREGAPAGSLVRRYLPCAGFSKLE